MNDDYAVLIVTAFIIFGMGVAAVTFYVLVKALKTFLEEFMKQTKN